MNVPCPRNTRFRGRLRIVGSSELSLAAYCKSVTSFCASSTQHFSPVFCLHPRAEAVGILPFPFVGLVCSFHSSSFGITRLSNYGKTHGDSTKTADPPLLGTRPPLYPHFVNFPLAFCGRACYYNNPERSPPGGLTRCEYLCRTGKSSCWALFQTDLPLVHSC